ncbi:unnamed protein product [Ilex paraguariensis]|uniref:Uncharacterized protein n=1 Tax=Ilex paraguariensis TaxID=185542 RepID=A0ABC8R0A7_9AQUA
MQNVNSSSESTVGNNNSISDFEESEIKNFSDGFSGESSKIESEALALEVDGLGSICSEGEKEAKPESLVEKDDSKSRLPVVVFFMGLFATIRKGFEKVMLSDWFHWWPFWRQEKRLERLIVEADANPKDAAKQSALLAELNKHRLGKYIFFFFVLVFC